MSGPLICALCGRIMKWDGSRVASGKYYDDYHATCFSEMMALKATGEWMEGLTLEEQWKIRNGESHAV